MDRTGQEAGIGRQERECRELAAAKGWKIVEVFKDNDVSAYSGRKRPGYEGLLEAIRSRRVNTVIAWHPDRLYRRLIDLEGLIDLAEEHGVRFATCVAGDIDLSTAAGRMNARVVASAARYESEHRAERLRLWHEDRVAKGLPHGGGRRPYGYEWSPEAGTWHPRPDEAAVIHRMVDHIIRGGSVSSLVRALNLEGVPTASGSRWANATVTRLLANPVIAGLREHRRTGTITQGNWEPIITLEQREMLQAIFKNPMRPKRGGGPTERSRLLSGLLVCAHCDMKMYSDGQKNGRYAYTCSKSWKGQGCVRVAAWPLEDAIYLMAIRHVRDDVKKGGQPPYRLGNRRAPAPEEESLIAERLKLLARRDELAAKYAEGFLDERQLKVGTARLDERIREVDSRLSSSMRRHEGLTQVELQWLADAATKPSAELDREEVRQRYNYLSKLIDRIEVRRASRRGLHLKDDPARVKILWRYWGEETLDPRAIDALDRPAA
jgi:DNA invertase Pin-like site-specific DNA recombinase